MRKPFTPPPELPYTRIGWPHVAFGSVIGYIFVALLDRGGQLPTWLSGKRFWIGMVPISLFLIRRFYLQVQSVAPYRDIAALINGFKLDEAWQRLNELEEKVGGALPLSYYRGSRAVIVLLNGQLEDCIALSNECLERNDLKSAAYAEVRGMMKYNLAVAYALKADGQRQAEEFLGKSREEFTAVQCGRLLFLEAIIAIRAGRFAVARQRITEEWSAFESLAAPNELKVLRILRAFASKALGDADYETLLAACHPYNPGEFDYLCVDWPELREFLENHDFVEKSVALSVDSPTHRD